MRSRRDTEVSPPRSEASVPTPSSSLDPALLQRAFAEAPDGILLADRDARCIEVNATLCEIFGRTRDEMIGTTPADFLAPQELERLAATRARLLAGATEHTEWRIRHGNGGEVVIEVSARILDDGHWLVLVRDVSARRYAEDARRHSADVNEAERRWLEAVIDTVPLGVLLFGPGARLTFNRRAEALLGMELSPTGGSAQYRSRILFPDGTPVPPERMISARVLRDGETVSGEEMLIQRPDGVRIPVLASAAPIRDATGSIVGGVGVVQDVTEQHRIQEAIRANERLLDGIFELLPVGVWIADRTGHVLRTNPAGLRIWGGARYVGPSEFGQYRAWRVDTGEPVRAEDWALARNETSIGELLRIQAFDGSFKTVLNSALPLRDEAGQFAGAVAVNEDVTSLQEIRERLQRALDGRDELLRIVSHDLRSPLQGIVLATQHITRELSAGGGKDLRPVTERILGMSRRMEVLIEDLLDVASIDAGCLRLDRAPLRPEALVREVVDVHQAQAEASGISLVGESNNGSPILADHARMVQALSNFVGNALKFTPAGGVVSIRAEDDGEAVRFSVVDSGPGISSEQMARAFDPFWQSQPADRRGRGLGLGIAKGIVEAHGGRIWLESELGHGTTACFTVPKTTTPATKDPVASDTRP